MKQGFIFLLFCFVKQVISKNNTANFGELDYYEIAEIKDQRIEPENPSWAIPGVDLDLPAEDLAKDEERYFNLLKSFTATEKKPGGRTVVDDVLKFESNDRASFDAAKFDYIISKSPRSMVIFKDSDTVLVPSDEILEAGDEELESMTEFEYFELSVNEIKSVKSYLEQPLIPASSCLSLSQGSGTSGSISLSFSNGILIKNSGSFSQGVSNGGILSISAAFTLGYKLSKSYSGAHSCSVSKGDTVRLFYKVFTFSLSPMYRKIVYDTSSGNMSTGNVVKMEPRKFLAGIPPIYYCATSSNANLRCEIPGLQFESANGDQFTSFVTSGDQTTIESTL